MNLTIGIVNIINFGCGRERIWISMRFSLSTLVVQITLIAGLAVWSSGPVAAETRVSGMIRGEQVWTKEGNPYLVTGDIIVAKRSTLTINSGVTVLFKPNIASQEGTNFFDLEILVRGTLIAEGAEGDTVVFTSDAFKPQWTDWQGIVLQGKEAKVYLKAVIIENANEGVKCMQGTVVATDVTIRRSELYGFNFIQGNGDLKNVLVTQIGNSGGTGIGINLDRQSRVTITHCFVVGAQNGIAFVRKSGGRVENSVISLCAARGIIIRNSNPEITGCTISGNKVGLEVSAGAKPVVNNNNIFQNHDSELELKEYGGAVVKLDFSNNWWGETHLGLIEERILDGLDDPAVKVFAVIDPVLTEATIPDAGEPQGN